MFDNQMRRFLQYHRGDRVPMKYRGTAVVLGVLILGAHVPSVSSPVCRSAAHHDSADTVVPGSTGRESPDHALAVAHPDDADRPISAYSAGPPAPGHSQAMTTCVVGSHCATTIPSHHAEPPLEAPLDVDQPGAFPAWGLHTAPPSHPTPPPRA